MLAWFAFAETTPSAPGTAPSSQPVANSANYLAAGVCGPLDDCDALDIVAQIAANNSGSTVDLFLQTSTDEINFFDAVHFPTIANGAAASVYRTCVTHTGQPVSGAPVVVGRNLSPALAAGTTVQGGWGSRCRLVMVAGSGTTAGIAIKVTVGAQRPRLAVL